MFYAAMRRHVGNARETSLQMTKSAWNIAGQKNLILSLAHELQPNMCGFDAGLTSESYENTLGVFSTLENMLNSKKN